MSAKQIAEAHARTQLCEEIEEIEEDEEEGEGEVSAKQIAASQAPSPYLHAMGNLSELPAAQTITEEAARHIANLTGVTNVIIPVSTLGFLFQRFDMLEKQLENLKPLERQSPAFPGLSATLAGTDCKGLVTRVSALEKVIENQNSIIGEMNEKCKLLLQDNAVLKESLNNVQNAFANPLKTYRKASQDSGSVAAPNCMHPRLSELDNPSGRSEYSSTVGVMSAGVLSRELMVSNIYEGTDKENFDVIYAILSTILPSIERDDIVSVRALQSDRHVPARSSENNPSRYRRPWVVKLSHSDLVKRIMYVKHKFTRFNTRDINFSGLDQETIDNVSYGKIFINEMLSKNKYAQFRSLKVVARGLDFKYFWHREGRFLAKLRDGETSQLINTAADLQAIAVSLSVAPPNSDTPGNNNHGRKTTHKKVDA